MTALDLIDELREHLEGSTSVTDLVKEIHHARAPKGVATPYLLYRFAKAEHEYSFGPADSGQTSEIDLELHAVNEGENTDIADLVAIAKAVHALMLTWTGGTNWTVRQRELREEVADAFTLEDRRYESITMSYFLIVEAN